jgi:hypothetical protein
MVQALLGSEEIVAWFRKKKNKNDVLDARITNTVHIDKKTNEQFLVAYIPKDNLLERVEQDQIDGNSGLVSKMWTKIRPHMFHRTSDMDDEHTTDVRTQADGFGSSFSDPNSAGMEYYQRMRIEDGRKAAYNEFLRVYRESVIGRRSLTIVVKNVFIADEGEKAYEIRSEDTRVQSILEDLDERVEMSDNLPKFCKSALKWGDGFIEPVVDANYSVVRLKWLNPKDTHRNEDEFGRLRVDDGFTMEDASGTIYARFMAWQVVHIRYDHEIENLYGTSFFDPGRRSERMYDLGKQSVMISRMVRTPKRYSFTIPMPKNIQPGEKKRLIKKMKMDLRKRKQADSDGNLDLRKKPMIEENDIYMPWHDKDMKPDVSMFDPGGFSDSLLDIYLHRDEVVMAYGVPPTYLGLDKEVRGRAHLGWVDIEFARTLRDIQKLMAWFQRKVYDLQLILLGIKVKDKQQYEIVYPAISLVDERLKEEVERLKWETASIANNQMGIPIPWLLEHVVGLSEADIEQIVPNLEPKTQEPSNVPMPGDRQTQFTKESVMGNMRLRSELSDLKGKIQYIIRHGLHKESSF